MRNGLVGVVKEAYSASLGEEVVPRPLMMPLVRGELVGLAWVRPPRVGQDVLAGIAELRNIAAAAGADEVVSRERRRTSPPPANSPSLARRRCPLTEVLDRLPNDFDHWLRCRSMPLVCSARGVAATRVPQRGLNGNPIRWSPPSRSCFVRVLCRSGWARPGS